MTVRVAPTAESPEIRLPEPTPGGEIFGSIGSPAIAPVALIFDQHQRVEVGSDGSFGLAGLPEGEHLLGAIYRGGMTSSFLPVTVRSGETTELLPIDLEEVAGVAYRLSPEICSAESGPDRIAFDRRRRTPDGVVRESVRVYEVPLEKGICSGTVEGLQPGPYSVVALDDRSDALADVKVEPGPGQVIEALLEPAVVNVHGRVITGEDHPLVDARIEFVKESVSTSTVTDADGRYEVSLTEPGRYRINVKATRFLPLKGFDRRIREGDQTIDLRVEGGVIELEIEKLDGSKIENPIQVELVHESGTTLAGFLVPDEGFEQQLPGLDLGEYEVRAFSMSGWNCEAPQTVELTESAPFATVELLLRKIEYRLRVVDPQGQPVPGAELKVGMILPTEKAPGVFDLPGAAPGQRIELRANGYGPVCRHLGQESELTLTLTPSQGEALIIFAQGVAPRGRVTGLPGSSCPVRLHLLDATVTRAESGSALTLRNLPYGEFRFVQGEGGSVTFSVPGPPVVFESGTGD